MQHNHSSPTKSLNDGVMSRRRFLSGTSMTLVLSACGGGGNPETQAPVLLSTASAGQALRAVATTAAEPSSYEISPASAWTGVAGSGFAVMPTDPLRQIAKPAARLIVPPNQGYTDSILVGVAAFANDRGSMIENLGLRSVIFHYEGNQVEVTQPSYETFEAANGAQVRYLGWWIRLKHDSRNGDANLYVEAIPNDGRMQRRVIGPYLFMPSATLYDLELTVAPSMPEITGSRYPSIRAALAYAARQKKDRPHVTLIEQRDDYTLESIGLAYVTGKGYATIDAAVPITIRGTSFAPGSPRTFYDGLHFRGANIRIDHQNMETIYHEGKGNQHWFDGVTVLVTGGADYTNPSLRGPKTFAVARNNPWYTECNISGVSNMVIGASLVRGCRLADGLGDIMTDARCVIGNYAENFDSSLTWAKDVPAFTVTYDGPEITATLELSGYNDQAARVFTAKVNGLVVGTLQVSKSASSATPCSAVVSWLNGLPGFRASLQDDSRRATMCSLPNLKGTSFGPANLKSTTLQVVTMFDIHSDVWQQLFSGITENVIFCDNVIKDHVGQCFFISTPQPARDFIFVNNCYYGKKVLGQYSRTDWFSNQLGRSGMKSHVVFAHNSTTQQWWFRTEDGFDVDPYCLFASNVAPSVNWRGKPTSKLQITDNHFYAMTTRLAMSTGTSIGGSEEQIWPRAAAGDFTPNGPLLYATAKPCVLQDSRGRSRQRSDVPGAVAR